MSPCDAGGNQDEEPAASMENQTMNCSDPAAAPGVHHAFRGALATLSGKWKPEILWCLNTRIHRFGELRRAIPGITQHMLTTQLRELERDGMLSRTIFAEVPPRVDYELTAKARDLAPVIDALFAWSHAHGGAHRPPGRSDRVAGA